MASAQIRDDRHEAEAQAPKRTSPLRQGWLPYVLSGALATIATVAAGLSLSFPTLLTGVPVGNGNLRGTAAAMLVVGLPSLTVAMGRTARGSARALVVWLGALGYLLYQAVMFCFATPLNNLFLIYVAYLSLAVWSLVALLRATDLAGFSARVASRMPARVIAGFAISLAVLNAAAWLAKILPAVVSDSPRTLLEGTGLLTNAVYIQDLAIWLPMLAAASIAAWRRAPWGLLVMGSILAMYVFECIGIATDQWFGSRADPLSDGASMAMVPAFAIGAVVIAVPLTWFIRNLDKT